MTTAVQIYTDGACRGNPGPGGWAAILRINSHVKEIWGAEPHTTNNKMELTAAIKAMEVLTRLCTVELITDSEYLRKGITEWLPQWRQRGWRTANKKPVKNKELWQHLDELSQGHQINWRWVKGHSGDAGNDRADELANLAIDEMLQKC
ncbi:MAG: ribonuclease HI [Gammaproteobacteria bacterium]|nr:ribonuclease HI [Gammaproteobacteria bacterium]